MTKRTEAELLEQEKMDATIYESTRSMFEFLLLRVLEKPAGEDRAKDVAGLLDTYNNTSEGCQRLMGMVRRLENSG